MNEIRHNCFVTIPAIDIRERNAATARKSPTRFSVWWTGGISKHDRAFTDPDLTVPSEMIIIENNE